MKARQLLNSDIVGVGIVFTLLAIWHGFIMHWGGINTYMLDDPYIIQHSVAGILSGSETRYIDSTPWTGVTSPFFVSLVVLLSYVLPIAVSHWIVNTASTFALALGIYVLARQNRLPAWMAAIGTLAALSCGWGFLQITNGLESSMAMAVIAWALVAFSREKPPIWGYVLVGMAFTIRPELAAIGVLCIAQTVWRLRMDAKVGVVVYVLTALAAAAFSYLTIGALTPSTADAKAVFFGTGALPLFEKVLINLKGFGIFCIIVAPVSLGLFGLWLSRAWFVGYGFITAVLLAYIIKMPDVIFANGFRYLYMFVPIMALGWFAALGNDRKFIKVIATATAIPSLALVALNFTAIPRDWHKYTTEFTHENLTTAKWAAENLPDDATIVIHDAGAVSLYGKQHLVDLVGLKTPSSIAFNRQHQSIGYDRDLKALPAIVANAKADYIIYLEHWDRDYQISKALKSAGWKLERVDPFVQTQYYQVHKLTPPADTGTAIQPAG